MMRNVLRQDSRTSGFRLPRWVVGFCLSACTSASFAQSVCHDMSFTDVTLGAGITHKYNHPATLDKTKGIAGGAVAEDFNNDGWLDLYVVQAANGAANHLYINDQAGGFVDEAAARGADLKVASVGASAADFDNDGDIDIAVSVAYGSSTVLINDGTGHFTSQILLPDPFDVTTSSSWGDIDNDGFLELAIGQWRAGEAGSGGQGLFMYKYDGAGGLSPYEFRTVARDETHVLAPRFADLNGDGWQDLHVVSDFQNSQLYMNAGGGLFDNVTLTNGTGGSAGGLNEMGHAIGDYDGDGDLDIFTSNKDFDGGNRLYNNDGNGVFSIVPNAAGMLSGGWGWAAAFGDLDNDGHLDLYHVNGWHTSSDFIDDPAVLFMNQGNGTFTEVAFCAGADNTGIGKGMLEFDYDNDGDLDIFIVNSQDMDVVGQDFPGTPALLRNDTNNGNHWLKVTLDGVAPLHNNGIGSRVYVQAGGSTMLRELHASSNYLAQDSGRIAHFGVGSSSMVNEVRAEWVSGDATVITDVTADQQIAVPSPVATVSARTVNVNELVTADAGVETSPVEWLIDGITYANPAQVSFNSVGTKELTLLVYDQGQSTVIRKEILRVEVTNNLPQISSPVPGSVLTGATQVFDWLVNGVVATSWQLKVGTAVGLADLYDSGPLQAGTMQETVTGLPVNGSTVFVRLLFTVGSVTNFIDYTYTAYTPPKTDPEITGPVPRSILTGSSQIFNWVTNGANISFSRLKVGTAVGLADLYDSKKLSASVLSATATNLPTNGSTVYVELSWKLVTSATTFKASYTYTAYTTPQPKIVTPLPGTILAGNSAVFSWTSNGIVVENWRLKVGTAAGLADFYDSKNLSASVLSATATNLPTNGSTVYVELSWKLPGVTTRVKANYTYTAFQPLPPTIASPALGSSVYGDSATFSWVSNGTSVASYRIKVGTTLGGSDVYASSKLASSVNSATVEGLPQDGTTVYVRLEWQAVVGGPILFADFTYTWSPETADERDHSVARLWSEVLLQAIRKDFARPTVHARNLWHISAAMYDAWAVYDDVASTYMLGQTVAGYTCDYTPPAFEPEVDPQLAREEAISYAAYRILRHRFATSPGAPVTVPVMDAQLSALGYDSAFVSTDTSSGSPAAVGNRIAECFIAFGHQDGSNEQNNYANVSYQPVNPALEPVFPGNPNIVDINRWQPIKLEIAIDQNGNPVVSQPPFLSAEWGRVPGFALTPDDLTIHNRDGFDYYVYHDPGIPPLSQGELAQQFKWNYELDIIWSSHLDPSDGVMVDISPASLGNTQSYPTSVLEYDQFYDLFNGFDGSTGYDFNPVTGAPYEEQWVPRGDYARVLAEFWADGPTSETPPGHWYVVLNEQVSDHPLLEKRIGGTGPVVGPLEWDVKSYFGLGGAIHDSAVTAWGIKGWYDYTRPVSAIRAMADLGQSSSSLLPHWHPEGLTLIEGYIELVEVGDPLAGDQNEHVDKIKVRSWRGPDFIEDQDVDQAGVDWILAENWWPYQRPTFVTPPFAGYISGHSTFSRSAAEYLTLLTGNEYFPGGMSSFEVTANEYLVFEEGPSVSMTLQWATYRDASDQCSLSRIYGGIHPPADDIPGRLIGMKIGPAAYNLATSYFNGSN